jgi:hypothetical protein
MGEKETWHLSVKIEVLTSLVLDALKSIVVTHHVEDSGGKKETTFVRSRDMLRKQLKTALKTWNEIRKAFFFSIRPSSHNQFWLSLLGDF